MSDLISVVIPVYKVEKFIRNCVDSVIAQTYKDLEIILVDDVSPDGCPAICDEYAAADKRIKTVHKENGGLSSARNAGLDVATGEYVFFVDSDDYISENAIERLYEALIKEKADIAICDWVAVDENGNKVVKKISPLKNECLNRDGLFKKITEPNYYYYVVSWNKLYKR